MRRQYRSNDPNLAGSQTFHIFYEKRIWALLWDFPLRARRVNTWNYKSAWTLSLRCDRGLSVQRKNLLPMLRRDIKTNYMLIIVTLIPFHIFWELNLIGLMIWTRNEANSTSYRLRSNYLFMYFWFCQ